MASPECKLSHIGHYKRLIISYLGGWQAMYTEAECQHHPPPPPPPRGEKFTSAGQGSSLNTSCKHCMRTTAGVQEHPGYSADATTPWQPCSKPPVRLDETAPRTGRLLLEMVCERTRPASPPTTFCSTTSQTGRGPAG